MSHVFCRAKLRLTRNIRHFFPQPFCNILEVGYLLQFTNPALVSQEEIYEVLSGRSQQCKDMQMHCHCSRSDFYTSHPVSNVSSARSWRRLSLGVNARVCRVPSLCKNDARARTATGAGGTERVRAR